MSALMLSGMKRREIDVSSEWREVKSILAYGVRVGLRTNKKNGLDLLSDYLPPIWKNSSSNTPDRLFSVRIGKWKHQLFEGAELAISSRSLKRVLEYFRTRLKSYVAEMARRRVFVHAGAVGWRGNAIVIPGRSMSGKTSLVSALVRAGATYYSDEYAVLDTRGLVHPYSQPLAVRKPGSFIQENRRPEELGGVSGHKPLPVRLVIVTHYDFNGRWRPRELSKGQGVLELLKNTVSARRKPEIVLPTLQRAVAEGIILKGTRGEAGELVDLLLKRAESG